MEIQQELHNIDEQIRGEKPDEPYILFTNCTIHIQEVDSGVFGFLKKKRKSIFELNIVRNNYIQSDILNKVKEILKMLLTFESEAVLEKKEIEKSSIENFKKSLPSWLLDQNKNMIKGLNWKIDSWINGMLIDQRGWQWYSSIDTEEGWAIFLCINDIPYQIEIFLYLLYKAGGSDIKLIDIDNILGWNDGACEEIEGKLNFF